MPQSAAGLAPTGDSMTPQVLLIPAHRCLLAARSFFFQTLFSGRWESSDLVPSKANLDYISGSGSYDSGNYGVSISLELPNLPSEKIEDGDGRRVTLPVVRLEEADAEGLLQLMAWMGSGRMGLLPAIVAAAPGAAACSDCQSRRAGVRSASLAGAK